jgi:hypothetical protein
LFIPLNLFSVVHEETLAYFPRLPSTVASLNNPGKDLLCRGRSEWLPRLDSNQE